MGFMIAAMNVGFPRLQKLLRTGDGSAFKPAMRDAAE
jgi:hypothetical protein